MKKMLAALAAISLVAMSFTACGKGNVDIDSDAEQNIESIDQVTVDVGGEDWSYDDTSEPEEDSNDMVEVDIEGAEGEHLGAKFSPEILPDGTLDEQSAEKVRRAIIQSLKGLEAYDVDTELTCTLQKEIVENEDMRFEDHECTQTSHSTYDGKRAHIEVNLQVDGKTSDIEAYYQFGKNFMPYKAGDTIQVWSRLETSYQTVEPNWYTLKKKSSTVTGIITPVTAEFINKMEHTVTSIPDETQTERITRFFASKSGQVVEEETTEDAVIETMTDEDGNIVEIENETEEVTETTVEETDATEESLGGIQVKDIDDISVDTGDGNAAYEEEKENPIEGIYQFSGDISSRWLGDITFAGLGLDLEDTDFMEDSFIHVDLLYDANSDQIVSVYMDMSKLVSDTFNSFIDRIPDNMDDDAGRYSVRDYIYSMNFSNYNNTEEIEIPEEVKEKALRYDNLGWNQNTNSIFIYF